MGHADAEVQVFRVGRVRVPLVTSTFRPLKDVDALKIKVDISIMTADALVYHPTVSHYLRFVATTGTFSNSALPQVRIPN